MSISVTIKPILLFRALPTRIITAQCMIGDQKLALSLGVSCLKKAIYKEIEIGNAITIVRNFKDIIKELEKYDNYTSLTRKSIYLDDNIVEFNNRFLVCFKSVFEGGVRQSVSTIV